ncbi:hypothetical protein D4764_0192270 [Takifugu flavidus]|uniref:Secreted protein n=1 Tax=Takifugu flavidus TaxID=433684 RepID=A0A5C6MGB4_9TELE|nr:hypothetical protein D4764_0192270 [Takifugu flavidus]
MWQHGVHALPITLIVRAVAAVAFPLKGDCAALAALVVELLGATPQFTWSSSSDCCAVRLCYPMRTWVCCHQSWGAVGVLVRRLFGPASGTLWWLGVRLHFRDFFPLPDEIVTGAGSSALSSRCCWPAAVLPSASRLSRMLPTVTPVHLCEVSSCGVQSKVRVCE